ncbi:MAG TPA: WD40 repeat domain-containing protein, partial [Gemmata sp.]|nr:WD40 repeat domain-containing protein [Gemmata sp.]
DGDWEVREYPSGRLLATLPAGLSVNTAIFSPDGRTLYTQAGPRLIVAWDIATGKPANASSNLLGPVMRFRFTPDGKLVGLAGGFVYTWDPLTGKELDRKRLPKPIDWYGAAIFSPSADRLHYTGLNDRLIAWDFHSGKSEEHDLNLHRLPNTAVLQWFTRDGSRHVEMDYENVALRFRDPATGKETAKTSIRGDWTLALGIIATDLSADGRRIAFASTNAGLSNDPPSNIAVLSIDGTGRPLTFQSPGIIRVLAMSPDGQLLVSCPNNSLSRDLIVWSASQGRRVASELLGLTESVNALNFSPDRRMLAISIGRHQVLLIETATWQVRASVPIPGRDPGRYLGYIEARDPVAWSADGHHLATATYDDRLMVWDIRKLAAASSITTAEDLEREWKKLSARDAKAAYAAIRSLAEAPEKALPLLKVKVAVVPVPDPAKVKAAIAALGSEEFAEREAATAELAKLGRLAEPAIRAELRTTGSPEVMRRLGDLLKKLDAAKPTAEEIAATRAVEI